MTTSEELWARFQAALLPHDELVAVIATHFSSARAPETDLVEYGAEDSPALFVRYKDEALLSIEPGPSLNERLIEAIESDIARELADQAILISRTFLFSNAPVNGWWRYRDMFQIMPAPPEAPRPIMLLADHPFVLEFTIRASPLGAIMWARRDTRLRQLQLVLNSLLSFNVKSLERGRHWVGIFDRDTLVLDGPFLADVMYSVEGFPLGAERFTDLDPSQAMTVEVDDDYYGKPGVFAGQGMSVPQSLPILLDGFFSLGDEDQLLFERAAYWFAHASEVWNLSRSAAFLALVQAVEVLVPPSPGGETCPTCHRSIGPGPTALFMGFLDHFVPELDARIRRTLYSVRSSITHGWSLLHSDYKASSMTLVPGQMEEWRLLEMARYPVQRVLIGWLTERAATI